MFEVSFSVVDTDIYLWNSAGREFEYLLYFISYSYTSSTWHYTIHVYDVTQYTVTQLSIIHYTIHVHVHGYDVTQYTVTQLSIDILLLRNIGRCVIGWYTVYGV